MSSQIHHEEHMESALGTFDSILQNQTRAIHHLVNQYKHSKFSQEHLKRSLNILNSSLLKKGKIVVCGIGKSHKIGSKIVATLTSLGVHSALLHPSEALHGDLGILRKENHDCMIMISASGKSPELLQLLPHISPDIPIVLLTNKKQSILSQHYQVKALLYAELPASLTEESIYGLNAPTISTTLCLTLADAVSIALAELYISDINERKKVFGERHPGGAIGEAYGKSLSQISSFLTTPTYSSSSLSSVGGSNDSMSPANWSQLSALQDEEPLPETKVVFELGFDTESVDDELAAKVMESKRVVALDQMFKNEIEVLQAVVLYDYIVVQQNLVISAEKLREITRAIHEHGYTSEKERLHELTWRLKQNLVKFR